MAHRWRLGLARGGVRLRLNWRGVPRQMRVRLSEREVLQVALFLLLMIIAFLLAMYLGWWTLQQEERESLHDHRDARREWVQPTCFAALNLISERESGVPVEIGILALRSKRKVPDA